MDTIHITELGRRFGLSRSALLYYDRIGLLRPGGRTAAGYRVYTQQDVARLERVCFFREAGLSLIEIERMLEGADEGDSILERRLRDIGRQVAALKVQQRLVAGLLKTVASGIDASGLDKAQWLGLQKACGLDDAALQRWHIEFERRAPSGHHDFLMGLGISEKEAIQIRMLTKSVETNKRSMEYFHELFDDLPRQAPGCDPATSRALKLVHDLPHRPRVLDVGCGSGAPTLIVAKELGASVVAIDNHGPMLERLRCAAAGTGLDIETREMSMIDMPFESESFDLIWAEGALFIVGLERGLRDFKMFLEPGGFLAFTELCWFTDDPSNEIKEYFDQVYPSIQTVDQVRHLARDCGYELVGDFELPASAWWDDYYSPMLERINDLRIKNAGVPEAESVYARCEVETEIYWRHSASYGYAFFVLGKKETP